MHHLHEFIAATRPLRSPYSGKENPTPRHPFPICLLLPNRQVRCGRYFRIRESHLDLKFPCTYSHGPRPDNAPYFWLHGRQALMLQISHRMRNQCGPLTQKPQGQCRTVLGVTHLTQVWGPPPEQVVLPAVVLGMIPLDVMAKVNRTFGCSWNGQWELKLA